LAGNGIVPKSWRNLIRQSDALCQNQINAVVENISTAKRLQIIRSIKKRMIVLLSGKLIYNLLELI